MSLEYIYVRKDFEKWIKEIKVTQDLTYDEQAKSYTSLDTEWLWLAFKAGYAAA